MAHIQNMTVIVIFTIFRHTLLRLQQAYEKRAHSIGGLTWESPSKPHMRQTG